MFPLHIAAKVSAPDEVVMERLQIYPEVALEKDSTGKRALNYAIARWVIFSGLVISRKPK